ncbi:MAG: hypothetical protein L0Y71_05120 [Gemmataceae bacterium]|nr:hypothetical protein [Gemmataceae bacterium]
MHQTDEAVSNDNGDANCLNEAALLSEAALAEDWNRPEEDAAWSYLRRAE